MIIFKNNKDKWKMTKDGKGIKIIDKLETSNKDEIQIELRPIDKITNISYMFSECSSLSSLSNIENLDTRI